jgi:hypothetical protein
MDAAGNKTGGRQKGTPNKATAEVRALASDYGPAAFRKLAELAGLAKDEAGNSMPPASSETARISAIGMLLDRGFGKALPGRLIEIDLPDTGTPAGVAQAVTAVTRAAACGQITTSEAQDLCGVLDVQRRAIELSDIEARLAKLEAAAEARP